MTIAMLGDFNARGLRATARRSKDAAQARRLLALAAVYDGPTCTEAAEIGGVTLQIVCDWVLKFNAEGPDGLVDRKDANLAVNSEFLADALEGESRVRERPVALRALRSARRGKCCMSSSLSGMSKYSGPKLPRRIRINAVCRGMAWRRS